MAESMPQLLLAQPLFADLPADAVDSVVGCAKNEVFDAGQLLLAEGAEATTLYLLRRGSVAIEVHSPGRGGLVVQTLGPGKVVGWSWLVPPFRWSFDARAVTPVGAVAIDGTCLREKADAQPGFGYALLQRISAMLLEQLHATQIQLLDLYGHGSDR
ncbi:MAG TPA: cyclic nucleotide-binding domain-containing protein [Acidimicrobiales bacterium]|nr:cyclic nucleotide-binding domain-containing protein [Acidimicrobiales bacterium]